MYNLYFYIIVIVIILQSCNYSSTESDIKTDSVEIFIDSIDIINPTKSLDVILDYKLKDIFPYGDDIIYVADNTNDSIYIIRNFNEVIYRLKYPENYRLSNNAPFVTIKDNILFFLTFSSGNLYKFSLGEDTAFVFIDSLYSKKTLNDLGLSVSCYPVTNTFFKQTKVINNNFYFLTIPSGYNESLDFINGKYSNQTTDEGYPLVVKYDFTSKEIDTLPIRAPIIPVFLNAGVLNNFYLCYTDSIIIATAPAFNNFIIYNIYTNSLITKSINSDYFKDRDILKEEDDVISYYYLQPYLGQLIFNNNQYFSQLYFHKQERKVDRVKNIFLREKSLIFYDNQLNVIKEILVPDSLSGFYKFTHKNDFFYSKIPNNDSIITFYKFSVVK